MKFYLTRKVIEPERGSEEAAGIDFFIPEIDESFIEKFNKDNPSHMLDLKLKQIFILPGERVLIPSGVKSEFAANTALIANNKSGVSTKLGLIVGACVVDSDYTGEIHLSLINPGNDVVTLKEKQKVIQFLHQPVIIEEIEFLNEYNKKTDRGDGGFGSTDKK